VRRLVLTIHLVLGLLAGTFMLLLGITGSIMAFEPELDRLLHANLSYVTPVGRALSLAEIGESVNREFPGEPVVAFLPSTSTRFPTQVILSRGIVSVNQYSGEILGVRARGRSFLGFVRALHTRLALGDVGRNILRWSAVALMLSLASGLYLWWPAKPVRIRARWWSAGCVFDLHNAVGIWSLLPMLALAITGIVIGFEDQAAALIDKLTHASPARTDQILTRPSSQPGSTQITPDEAVAFATAQLPGAVPYRIQMPRFGGTYVVALENSRDRVTGERNSIGIDPWSGNVLTMNLSGGLTSRERLMAVNEAIHTGTIAGVPGRVIASLVSVVLPVQFLSGVMIWMRRRKNARLQR